MGGKFANRSSIEVKAAALLKRAETYQKQGREYIRRGLVLRAEADVLLDSIPRPFEPSSAMVKSLSKGGTPTRKKLATEMRRLLKSHNGNVSAIARSLDKHPIQIRRWARYLRVPIRPIHSK